MGKGILEKVKAWANRHKRWLLLGGAALVAVAAFSLRKNEVEVTAHTVGLGPVKKIIESSAVVESTTARSVTGQVAGEVLEVRKSAGDPVTAGEILAVVDVRDLELSIRGLEAQKASIAASMRDASTPSPESLRQAQAQMELDRIAEEAARRNFTQKQALFESGAESADAFKAAEEALKRAEQASAISRASYDSLRKGISGEQRKRFEADMNALQAQIDQVRLNRDKFQVKSPVAGVVTLKAVEVGTVVTPGALLFEIDDPAAIRLAADLLVQDAARIKAGVPVRAYDTDAAIEVTGKISKIHPKAFDKVSDLGIEQKRVRVEMTPDAGSARLTIGMELDLEIVEQESANVLNVPDSALFRINGKPHVFRIVDGKAVLTPVVTGLEGEDTVEVTDGLAAGEQVIDAPGNELADGTAVKIEQQL